MNQDEWQDTDIQRTNDKVPPGNTEPTDKVGSVWETSTDTHLGTSTGESYQGAVI